MPPPLEKFPRQLVLVPNHSALQLCVAETFLDPADPRTSRPAPPIRILSQWAEELVTRSELLAGRSVPGSPPGLRLARLWNEVIGADSRDLAPAERVTLARTAMDAERLLHQWLDPSELGATELPAAARFRHWRSTVAAQRRAQGWSTPGWHLDRLAELLVAEELPASCVPRTVILRGFGEITAQEQRLLDALGHAGVSVEDTPTPAAATPELVCYTDLDAELAAAAQWASEALGRSQRVAVVVNGLHGVRERVVRIFEDALAPGAILGFGQAENAPFRVAGGTPLSSHPLVRSALGLLKLSLTGPRQMHDFPAVSRWLLSPGWTGADSERFGRALLEHQLRVTGDYRWSLARVAELAEGVGALELRRLVSRMPRQAGLIDWLNHWGWPGQAPLDALAGQAVARFLELVEQVAALVPTGGFEAFAGLSEWCADASLDVGGGALSPVQVLSPEEALCGRFDAAWLANFTDLNWPGAPYHNGLLTSAALDAIERARPEGQLRWARGLSERLKACAPSVRLSWSEAEQGVPQTLSPLMGTAPEEPKVLSQLASLARHARPEGGALAGYRDHPFLQAVTAIDRVPLAVEPERLKSAVRLLELQSACPFAAFLVHRLQGRFERSPPVFASPAYTGGLVHRSLEVLYRPCLASPRRPSPDDVPAAVDAALESQRAEFVLLPAILVAERDRIIELLREWLAFEADRPATRTLALERSLQGRLSDFGIELRMDRVDEQPDGGLLVIDYKTGSVGKPRWGEERLGDLQLPLYAVLLAQAGEDAGGVALAQLRWSECHLRGMSRDETLCDRKLAAVNKAGQGFDDWAQALQAWSQWLASLAQEYRDGHCEHRLHFEAPLQYAGLEPLLRSAERIAWEAAHEPD